MKINAIYSVRNTVKLFMLGAALLLGVLRSNAQISVTATAGTLGPTVYTQLRFALAAINAGTHQGVINISVTGNTTETATGTLARSGTGAANYTSITIKPAIGTNPVITSNLANGPIYFNGASNVTIDGSNTVGGTTKNLTIQNLSATGYYIIRFGSVAAGGASNNTVKNCILTGGSTLAEAAITAGAGGAATTVYGIGTTPNNNNTIQNNTISNVDIAVYVYGLAAMDNGWTITGNNMSNLGISGVTLYDVANSTVNNNVINGVSQAYAYNVSGIIFSYNINGIDVYANQINNVNNPYGVGSYGAQGIYMDIETVPSNVNIYNNYVSNVVATPSANIGTNGHGIYMDWGDGINVYDNSINMATSQGGGVTAGLCFDPFLTLTNINVVNNISVNAEAGGSQYAIYSSGVSSMFNTINYNDYFSSGNLGYIGGVNCATIAQIQANFGGNLNSITPYGPSWVSTTNLDLNIVPANNVLNAGTFATVPSITTDIHGTTEGHPNYRCLRAHLMSASYYGHSNNYLPGRYHKPH